MVIITIKALFFSLMPCFCSVAALPYALFATPYGAVQSSRSTIPCILAAFILPYELFL